MRHTVYLAIMACALTAAAQAQNKPSCKLAKLAELPVTMSGLEPIIKGTLNGRDARFLVDTGAFHNVISTSALSRFGIEPDENRWLRVTGIAGSQNAWVARAKEFTLDGLELGDLNNMDFAAVSTVFNYGTVGLIGQNVLANADVEFDLAHGVIRLFRSTNCQDQHLAYWQRTGAISVLDIEEVTKKSPHFKSKVIINNRKAKVMFDTGAARSMITRMAAKKAGVDVDDANVVDEGFVYGTGGRVRVWLARFDVLDLGGEQIKGSLMRVGDTDLAKVADIVLGADFFLSHRMYFSKQQAKLYFTYNGGPVFNLRADSPQTNPQLPNPDAAPDKDGRTTLTANPTDADGFRRRAAASMTRMNYTGAMADFEQAIKLSPNDAGIYAQRAFAHAQMNKPALAIADMDRAIAIKPGNAGYYSDRGRLHVVAGNQAAAIADFDSALKLAPRDNLLTAPFAHAFDGQGWYDDAIRYATAWIDAFPEDRQMIVMLTARCASRAKANKELQLALQDCNQAIDLHKKWANAYYARALVHLRTGDLNKAIGDFKTAMGLHRDKAWSQYGLGVAYARKGNTAQSNKYLRAALETNAKIATEFKKFGMEP